MAPSKPRDPSPPAGFLSNVFGFVSRELESFVTTAVGGDATVSPRAPLIDARAILSAVGCSTGRAGADTPSGVDIARHTR